MAPQPGRKLLGDLSREVAGRLEAGALPRPVRAEARRLVLEAWLCASRPCRTAVARAVREGLCRRLDALILSADRGGTPEPAFPRPAAGARPVPGLATPLEGPILSRLDALEAGVDRLARRTRVMVEHAEAAAAGTTAPTRARPAAKPKDAGRESLELVWGDNEE